MHHTANELRATVAEALVWLRKLPEGADARRPAPNKWSPKEIIGHLIDSASVNHERFVRAQMQDSLVFSTYEQDRWVAAQQYQGQVWSELLDRWRAFNEQVAAVIDRIADRDMTRQRFDHNLHMIAWSTVSPTMPATLEYFVNDYVGHLRHHLAQIEAMTGAGRDGRTTSTDAQSVR
jgi:hypothetical protein